MNKALEAEKTITAGHGCRNGGYFFHRCQTAYFGDQAALTTLESFLIKHLVVKNQLTALPKPKITPFFSDSPSCALDKMPILSNPPPMKITVTGRSGRMGQTVMAAIEAETGATLQATHDSGEDLASAMAEANVIIDFTLPVLTDKLLATAVEKKIALVIGTTGHSDEQKQAIAEAAKSIPIVYASNFSTGVNLLFHLTRKAATILGNETFDIEVTEMHHRHKVDAPSGTARTLLDILNEETKTSYEDNIVHGREGNVGPRPSKEIGMHTLRGGDVVGDHTVMFAADGERFELTHKASSRMTFASGAVRAALWLEDREAGLYDMQNVLGLQ